MDLVLQRGMKRSGNHVVASWFTKLSGRCFVNNLVPMAPGGVLRAELPARRHSLLWVSEHVIRRKCRNPLRHFVSLEDLPISWNPFRRPPSFSILVIREPLNMFASRLRKGTVTGHPAFPVSWGTQLKTQVEMWKSYARAGLQPSQEERRYVVLFDEFLVNASYRLKTAELLGLEGRNEPEMTHITRQGGGSSFTGTKGVADSRFVGDVLSRSRFLEGPERDVLEKIQADEELAKLWEDICSAESSLR